MFVTTAVLPTRDVNGRSQTNMELPWVIYDGETQEPSLWNHHRWLGVPWSRCIWYDLDIREGLCKVWVALHTQSKYRSVSASRWLTWAVCFVTDTAAVIVIMDFFLLLSFCFEAAEGFSTDLGFNKWIYKVSKLTWAACEELWGTFILLPLIPLIQQRSSKADTYKWCKRNSKLNPMQVDERPG